jgi:hypothetical protein
MNVMNRWQALLGTTLLSFGIFAACSDTSESDPRSNGGSAGSTSGGAAGSSGKAGSNNPQGGSTAEAGAGSAEGGSPTSGHGGALEGGAGGAPAGEPGKAVHGQRCSVESTIGVVQLAGFPQPYVQVTLYDRPDPWIGEPELTTATCAFHQYTPGVCQGCEAGEVCSLANECVTEQRTIKDASLVVRTGGEQREYEADAQLGGIYSMIDIGDANAQYGMTLSWGEIEVTLEPMPVASAELAGAAVMIEGDSSQPGALDATWQPSGNGAFVRSLITINHHASGPTFTECAALESAGAFHADAEMVDPLAVVTGLEFQGLEHQYIGSANTPQGCVEFRFGEQLFVFPN